MGFKKIISCRITGDIDVIKLFKLRNTAIKGKGIKKRISRLRYMKMINHCGAFIPLNCCIGEDCIFPHGIFGCFVSNGAVIGDSCVIFHQVTIGSNTLSDSKGRGFPTIGNNVYIGAGAKIIGNVKVGNNVRIGANCVVTTDIPDNSTVVMHKPVVIKHEGIQNNKFISYKELSTILSR